MDAATIPGSVRDVVAILLLYRIAYIVGPRLVAWHAYGAELLEALAKAGNVQVPPRPAFLSQEGSMLKRISTPLLALLAAFLLTLTGCSGLTVKASAPAFQKDVDQVREDHDQALAQLRGDLGTDVSRLREDTTAGMVKLREDLSAADLAIRSDVAAAAAAGAAAEARAIAEGKSHADAIAERLRAEAEASETRTAAAIAKAKLDLVDAQTALEKRAKDAAAAAAEKADQADTKATAAKKAATTAAEESSSSSTPWWLAGVSTILLMLAQRFGLTGLWKQFQKSLEAYDAAPFEGAGVTLTEAQLVAGGKAMLQAAAGAGQKPAA